MKVFLPAPRILITRMFGELITPAV